MKLYVLTCAFLGVLASVSVSLFIIHSVNGKARISHPHFSVPNKTLLQSVNLNEVNLETNLEREEDAVADLQMNLEATTKVQTTIIPLTVEREDDSVTDLQMNKEATTKLQQTTTPLTVPNHLLYPPESSSTTGYFFRPVQCPNQTKYFKTFTKEAAEGILASQSVSAELESVVNQDRFKLPSHDQVMSILDELKFSRPAEFPKGIDSSKSIALSNLILLRPISETFVIPRPISETYIRPRPITRPGSYRLRGK